MSLLTKAFKCSHNYVKNTDGSVLLTEGKTAVIAGVYGPADIRESKQNVSKGILELNFRPKTGMPALKEKYCEQFVRQVFESAVMLEDHPRSCFYVIMQINEDFGSLLSTSINAATLALNSAGVSMRYMPISICVAVCEKEDFDGNKNEVLVVSPDKKEEEASSCVVTFTFEHVDNKLMVTQQEGVISSDKLDECLELAKKAALLKKDLMTNIMKEKYIGCR